MKYHYNPVPDSISIKHKGEDFGNLLICSFTRRTNN